MSYEDVRVEALSFFDRARKAVVSSVAAGVTTAAGVIGTALVADGFSIEALGAGVAAGALAALAALRVTYKAKANEPSLDIPPKRVGV